MIFGLEAFLRPKIEVLFAHTAFICWREQIRSMLGRGGEGEERRRRERRGGGGRERRAEIEVLKEM